MINKVYEKLKLIVKENYKFILFLLIFYLSLTIPLPYYIHTSGGLIDISDKVTIKDEYDKSGSLNLAYVTEMDGNVLNYLLSYVIPDWDLVSQKDYVATNETKEEVEYRNHILLDEANTNAMMVAYNEAGKMINVKEKHFYVVYVDDKADTTLKIGDEIIKIEGKQINDMKDYIDVVSKVKSGDNLSVIVISKDNKMVSKTAKVYQYEGRNVTGIMVSSKYIYDTNPKITFHFKESESGPSGGLMMALAIYNKLVPDDLTKGLTIVGTGTIDIDGNVGDISGIEYKLKGAIKAKADIFLVPNGKNYDEALALITKNNYNIKLVGVSTFSDAINYLRSV